MQRVLWQGWSANLAAPVAIETSSALCDWLLIGCSSPYDGKSSQYTVVAAKIIKIKSLSVLYLYETNVRYQIYGLALVFVNNLGVNLRRLYVSMSK